MHKVSDVVRNYINDISKGPVVPQIEYQELCRLIDDELPREGVSIDRLLRDIEKDVVPNCTKIGHARFLAWLLTSPSLEFSLPEHQELSKYGLLSGSMDWSLFQLLLNKI